MLFIEHLYFSYQGQPPYVLNDLNLHIHSGDYISIVGDNGCGKSTLLRLILGFLTPVKGSIKRNTNNIRYVSQKNDFSHAGFPITVKEILDSYRKLLKIKDKNEVNRVLELTNMTEFKDRLISKLSVAKHSVYPSPVPSSVVLTSSSLTNHPQASIEKARKASTLFYAS